MFYNYFFFFEYFIKAKNYNSEFTNYFVSKNILFKNFFSTKIFFFTCWIDLNDFFLKNIFYPTDEVFEGEDDSDFTELDTIDLNFSIFSKFNSSFSELVNIIKKNFFKLCILFYKRKFFLNMFSNIKKKKYKKLLYKKYKNLINVKA